MILKTSRLAIVIAAGLFIFSLSRFVTARLVQGPAPVIVIAPDDVDLGSVRMGEPIQRRFLIRNGGDARLLITDVQSTCQCTVADLPSRAVLPGGSAQMVVTFNARARGRIDQEVLVKSNDPATPSHIIKLTAMATTQP